jgi:hypothetical protein
MANATLIAPAAKSEAVRDGVMRITVSFFLVARLSLIDGVQRSNGFQIRAGT